MTNTEPLTPRYLVPADQMPLAMQFQQLERALNHLVHDPEWRAGIPPALAYIDAMQIRLTEMRQQLVELQSSDEEQP